MTKIEYIREYNVWKSDNFFKIVVILCIIFKNITELNHFKINDKFLNIFNH